MPRSTTRRTAEEWQHIRKKKKLEAAMSPEDREIEKMKALEATRIKIQEAAEKRHAARKKDPILAEHDRLLHREAMRVYMAKRRAEDPQFLERSRAANKESARKRRALTKGIVAEVDET